MLFFWQFDSDIFLFCIDAATFKPLYSPHDPNTPHQWRYLGPGRYVEPAH